MSEKFFFWFLFFMAGPKFFSRRFFFSGCPPRRAAARAASPPPPPPLPRQTRRRPPASSTSPRSSSCAPVSRCESPADIARVAAVSLLFHASLALEGIRLWAQERGFELPALPEGEGCAVRWLCFAALLCESNPPARAAAGSSAQPLH